MRRFAALLALGTALLAAGCARSAGTGAVPNWVAPAAATSSAGPSDAPSGDPSGDPSPSATPSTAPSAAGTPSATPKPAPPPAGSGLAEQLLAQVNQLRAQNHLPAYHLSSGLIASAHRHNLAMIPPSGCGLAHKCPNEPNLGPRISDQGVTWSSLGENIGESGPIANTQAAILAAAKGLTMSMYNEKAPDDGHRRNILSRDFKTIGIDVVRDSRGTVWLTQDFAG